MLLFYAPCKYQPLSFDAFKEYKNVKLGINGMKGERK